MKPKDIAIYIFLAVAWGLSFLVILRSVNAFGWAAAVTFRCFIASTTLYLIARLSGHALNFRGNWKGFTVIGATTVAGQLVGLSYSTPLIGTAMAAICVATIPLFSMVISQLWGLERMTIRGFAGLVLGIAGIVLLVGFPAIQPTATFALGAAAALFACISAAFGSNYASRQLRSTGSWEMTIGAFALGGIFTAPLLFVVPVPATPGPVDFLYLIISACVMSAMTYIFYFRLVASIGPTKAVSVEFAVTIIAVLVGAIFLREQLSAIQYAGAAIIISGCTLVLGARSIPPRNAQETTPLATDTSPIN